MPPNNDSNARKWRRVHGLQAPLHPQQVTAWVLLLLFGCLTHLLVAPAFASPLARLIVHVANGVLYLLHFVVHFAATLVDPADPNLRAKGREAANRPVPKFDRSRHAHVIENGRCHLCSINISSQRTKHCSACNKCVDSFDHHCKWLNQCIGKRNYPYFAASVVTAILLSVLYVCAAGAVMILFYLDKHQLRPWAASSNSTYLPISTVATTTTAATPSLLNNNNVSRSVLQSERVPLLLPLNQSTNEDFDIPPISSSTPLPNLPPTEAISEYSFEVISLFSVPNSLALIILGTTISLALISVALLTHLLFFHVYINHVGITTYEYVRAQRLEQERRARESQSSSDSQEQEQEQHQQQQQECKKSRYCCSACCSKRDTQVDNFTDNDNDDNDSKSDVKQLKQRRSKGIFLCCYKTTKEEAQLDRDIEEQPVGKQTTTDEVFTINVDQNERPPPPPLTTIAPAPPKPPRRIHSGDSSHANTISSSPSTDITSAPSSSSSSTNTASDNQQLLSPKRKKSLKSSSTVPKLPSIAPEKKDAKSSKKGHLKKLDGELKVEEADSIPGATEIITLHSS